MLLLGLRTAVVETESIVDRGRSEKSLRVPLISVVS